MTTAPAFRFNPSDHSYWIGDQRVPSVTQILSLAGLVNGEQFFTEESRKRGTEVHELRASWIRRTRCGDGADDAAPVSLGYIAASAALKPTWDAIEEATVSHRYRFGTRTDRVGVVFARQTIAELKSAAKAKHHAIQTAMQAIAESERWHVAPETFQRLTIYLTHNGKWSVDMHEDRRDFDTAYKLIKEFC